jgi:hypothetical protein
MADDSSLRLIGGSPLAITSTTLANDCGDAAEALSPTAAASSEGSSGVTISLEREHKPSPMPVAGTPDPKSSPSSARDAGADGSSSAPSGGQQQEHHQPPHEDMSALFSWRFFDPDADLRVYMTSYGLDIADYYTKFEEADSSLPLAVLRVAGLSARGLVQTKINQLFKTKMHVTVELELLTMTAGSNGLKRMASMPAQTVSGPATGSSSSSSSRYANLRAGMAVPGGDQRQCTTEVRTQDRSAQFPGEMRWALTREQLRRGALLRVVVRDHVGVGPARVVGHAIYPVDKTTMTLKACSHQVHLKLPRENPRDTNTARPSAGAGPAAAAAGLHLAAEASVDALDSSSLGAGSGDGGGGDEGGAPGEGERRRERRSDADGSEADAADGAGNAEGDAGESSQASSPQRSAPSSVLCSRTRRSSILLCAAACVRATQPCCSLARSMFELLSPVRAVGDLSERPIDRTDVRQQCVQAWSRRPPALWTSS